MWAFENSKKNLLRTPPVDWLAKHSTIILSPFFNEQYEENEVEKDDN